MTRGQEAALDAPSVSKRRPPLPPGPPGAVKLFVSLRRLWDSVLTASKPGATPARLAPAPQSGDDGPPASQTLSAAPAPAASPSTQDAPSPHTLRISDESAAPDIDGDVDGDFDGDHTPSVAARCVAAPSSELRTSVTLDSIPHVRVLYAQRRRHAPHAADTEDAILAGTTAHHVPAAMLTSTYASSSSSGTPRSRPALSPAAHASATPSRLPRCAARSPRSTTSASSTSSTRSPSPAASSARARARARARAGARMHSHSLRRPASPAVSSPRSMTSSVTASEAVPIPPQHRHAAAAATLQSAVQVPPQPSSSYDGYGDRRTGAMAARGRGAEVDGAYVADASDPPSVSADGMRRRGQPQIIMPIPPHATLRVGGGAGGLSRSRSLVAEKSGGGGMSAIKDGEGTTATRRTRERKPTVREFIAASAAAAGEFSGRPGGGRGGLRPGRGRRGFQRGTAGRGGFQRGALERSARTEEVGGRGTRDVVDGRDVGKGRAAARGDGRIVTWEDTSKYGDRYVSSVGQRGDMYTGPRRTAGTQHAYGPPAKLGVRDVMACHRHNVSARAAKRVMNDTFESDLCESDMSATLRPSDDDVWSMRGIRPASYVRKMMESGERSIMSAPGSPGGGGVMSLVSEAASPRAIALPASVAYAARRDGGNAGAGVQLQMQMHTHGHGKGYAHEVRGSGTSSEKSRPVCTECLSTALTEVDGHHTHSAQRGTNARHAQAGPSHGTAYVSERMGAGRQSVAEEGFFLEGADEEDGDEGDEQIATEMEVERRLGQLHKLVSQLRERRGINVVRRDGAANTERGGRRLRGMGGGDGRRAGVD